MFPNSNFNRDPISALRHTLCFTVHRVKTQDQRAFSLVELLTVISIIAILAALLLSAMVSAKARSRQAACINNLRQIGLAFTGFALDHDGKYPMDVPERLGGSSEYITNRLIENTPFSRDFHHFAALSNEAPNPKVLVCPADRKRRPAENYQTFTNANLSYWANMRAVPHASLASLAGDWNAYNATGISNNWEQINFGREVHVRKGSVLFADGRVEITRSLTIEATPPPGTIDPTTPTTTSTATPAGVAPNARPQPNAPGTPTPTPATTSPPTVASTTGQPAAEKKPDTRAPRATNELATGAVSTSAGRFPTTSRRVTAPAETGSRPPAEAPTVASTVTRPVSADSGPSDGDPWDTPGFRLFKLLAFASYMISLLWAIIALLILYLRARIAQRQQESAAAINMD
jgi:prepilin-type N-terminal cleavage/methylation domain-containing protein